VAKKHRADDASLKLAEYLTEHAEVLHPLLREALDPAYIHGKKEFLRTWLQSQQDFLAGRPPHTTEWITEIANGVRKAGAGLADLLEQLRRLRLVLLDYCRQDSSLGDHGPCHEQIRRLAEHHDRKSVDYWAQLQRETLAAERRRQRAIAESVRRPFVMIDQAGVIQVANKRFTGVFATLPKDLIGKPLVSLCPPETGTELRRCLRHQTSKGLREFVGRLIIASGKHAPARFLFEPLFDAEGLRDGATITLEGPETWPQGEQDFVVPAIQAFVSALPACLQVFDVDGRPVYTMGDVAGLLGRAAESDLPLCCHVTRVNGKKPSDCPCRQVIETGTPFLGELSVTLPAGQTWYQCVCVPMRSATGEIARAACLLYDDSKRRQLDRHLQSLLLEYQQTPLAAQLAMTVAHELRNPLAVLVGFAEMLAQGVPASQAASVVDKILHSAMRCKEIVEQLLELGRGGPSERLPMDIRVLVNDLVQPVFSAAEQGRIAWNLPSLPSPVECVPGQLAQVCINLLRNALRASRGRVSLCVGHEPEHIRMEVSDDGPGVPDELREHIFKPFFTTYKAFGALGLGLSLSQAVIQEYGGRLWLAKKEDEKPGANRLSGACFVAELPLFQTQASALSGDASGSETAQPPDRKCILVVDDEPDLVEMVSMILSMHGYSAESASSGVEALEKCQQNAYDAIILDVQLPGGLDGTDCYDRLRTLRPALAKKSMFMTADTMSFQTRQFLSRIQRPYLEKPFLMREFLDAVRGILEE